MGENREKYTRKKKKTTADSSPRKKSYSSVKISQNHKAPAFFSRLRRGAQNDTG